MLFMPLKNKKNKTVPGAWAGLKSPGARAILFCYPGSHA